VDGWPRVCLVVLNMLHPGAQRGDSHSAAVRVLRTSLESLPLGSPAAGMTSRPRSRNGTLKETSLSVRTIPK